MWYAIERYLQPSFFIIYDRYQHFYVHPLLRLISKKAVYPWSHAVFVFVVCRNCDKRGYKFLMFYITIHKALIMIFFFFYY